MKQNNLKIIIYSDYICPFCYIGFYRIKKLKEEFNFEVEWRSFELHPETPKSGVLVDNLPFAKEYLEMVMINVKRLADEVGIKFTFSGKLPNSRLALYVSEFARKKGKFNEFHELIFDTYWKEGKDIGDLTLLLDLAESIGLEKNELLDYIESDEPQNMLKKTSLELGNVRITGVPTFIIGDRVVVGAQPYETFQTVIEEVLEGI
ncbi:hypothetical protein LCGC14_0412960 [marine sediment metagenome]|uniref:DSBA-like thioredoxin domain-containing protein n=1 Tax=marine sediment metagenome TaxID=412755 RepID=A0A0F9TB99_9ZZZZ|nr:DsbA family oxidoreductase [archaeon]